MNDVSSNRQDLSCADHRQLKKHQIEGANCRIEIARVARAAIALESATRFSKNARVVRVANEAKMVVLPTRSCRRSNGDGKDASHLAQKEQISSDYAECG